jgi:hypothetical protein
MAAYSRAPVRVADDVLDRLATAAGPGDPSPAGEPRAEVRGPGLTVER